MSVAIVSTEGKYETFVVRCDRCHKQTEPVMLRRPETYPYAFIPMKTKENKKELSKAAKLAGLIRRSEGKHLCKECNAEGPKMKQLDLIDG